MRSLDKRRFLTLKVAVVIVTAFGFILATSPQPASAQSDKQSAKKPVKQSAKEAKPIGTVTHRGLVIRAGNGRLVITFGTEAPHTHPVAQDAKITLDGKQAKLADLQKGDVAEITCAVALAQFGSRAVLVPRGPVYEVKAERPKQPKGAEKPKIRVGLIVAPSPGGPPLVADVQENSPAAKSGVQPGDFVISLDGKKMKSPESLIQTVSQKRPGDNVSLTVWRNGEEKELQVQLSGRSGDFEAKAERKKDGGKKEDAGKRKEAGKEDAKKEKKETRRPRDNQQSRGDQTAQASSPATPWLGVLLSAAPEKSGVRIARIYLRGPAAEAGLKPGDRILEVNGKVVERPADVARHVRQSEPGSEVEVTILRDGRQESYSVKVGDLKDFHQRLFGEDYRSQFEDFHRLFDPNFDGIPDMPQSLKPVLPQGDRDLDQSMRQLLRELRQLRQDFDNFRREDGAGNDTGATNKTP